MPKGFQAMGQEEFKRRRRQEFAKWDGLLNAGKIDGKDWLRHIKEFEEEYPEETAIFKKNGPEMPSHPPDSGSFLQFGREHTI